MTIRLSDPAISKRLAGPMLVDGLGLPRYWSLAWSLIDGHHLKASHLTKQLSAIEFLYQATEARLGSDCLDQILTIGDIEKLQPVLDGVFVELSGESLRRGFGSSRKWTTIMRFVLKVLERGAATEIGQIHQLGAKLHHLNRLYDQLITAQPFNQRNYRALPSAVVEDLYELFDPSSDRNPFRSEGNATRNYAIFLLLLHMGLRRSEACLLQVDSVKEQLDPRTGELRHWINITPISDGVVDTRASPAVLKTRQSARQLPIGAELAAWIAHYVQNYRGIREHPFLFTSQKGAPLSLCMVNSIFATASKYLSASARRELIDRRGNEATSPHDLRHTAAVFRLAEFVDIGDTVEVAAGKMRAFFGWSRNSSMPYHYAAAYFESRLATVWESKFDADIHYLRSLGA